jgi:dTMP kinase
MKLVVIEGIDGSGKSTQIRMLQEFLKTTGRKSEYLHFPRTEAPYFGELVARFLRGEFGSLNQVDPYLVAMLYAGDRKDASATIKKWLSENKTVLLDRYTYSNIAYQCAKMKSADERKKLMDWILSLEFIHFGIPRPDINIFLDVPFSFTERKLLSARGGADRSYLNGSRDIHEESMSFQRTVRDIYLNIEKNDPSLALVNCSNEKDEMLSPDIIFSQILDLLRNKKIF